MLSNVLFAIGNLVCGLATNHYAMIVGRVIAGVGGGGMISIATFLTSDLTPLRKRGILQGIANLWFGAGAMLGAVIGGLFHDHTEFGWRLAFLVQVPPALLLIPTIGLLVKVPAKKSEKTYLARIDFLGVFLTSSFLILLLLGLNTGGNTVPWTHPLPLTTIPLSILCFAGFIWWESKVKQPIIPVGLLRDRTVLSACAASLFISMLLMATTFYVPLYLQVLGDSTTTAGLKFLPSPLGGSIGALGTGYAMAWTGRYRRFGILGALALTLGTVLFTFQSESSSIYLTCGGLLLVGGGFSAVLTIATVSCLAAVDHSQQALITSTICKY
jgi:predicted MFS family arabinose efflux permease